jgi:two-component system, OmpR family, response regulator
MTIETRRIIVCDDDEDILAFLAFMLRTNDYDVRVARSYEEVMALLETYEPDLLLLDIRMPELDGFNVAETLRLRNTRFPIVFMTAHDNTFCRLYATTFGAAGYLKKPFEADDVLAVIEKTFPLSGSFEIEDSEMPDFVAAYI